MKHALAVIESAHHDELWALRMTYFWCAVDIACRLDRVSPLLTRAFNHAYEGHEVRVLVEEVEAILTDEVAL